ncbi:exonuclease 1 isoform X2 [Pelodiscus sinensis]|uniref:exonuclease 1 isoform X2 n=1 Tax=Pelodiscus sinensis TaxID=13735 RepID=UPI003F6D6907
MGIHGLLQFIKEAAEPAHVKKYKGQVVAVDTYCWLHKGAYACAEKLARGEPTDQYVIFCMKLVDMLLSFGIKPVLVFDGCTLPSKKEVEKARREKRQASLLKGKQLLREGKLSEARDCFGRSVNVTHAMAHEVIKAARAQGIDCIVAPYEADAQLAYLNKTGIVQAIITEDSDLLAFGCKKVFLKIDKFGNGLEIDQARLGKCKQLGDVFTEEKFRYMCILSGCDYLPSLHGIGLAKACKLLKLASNPDIIKVIKKIGQYLKMNITVSEEYIEGFIRANNTFLYQLVFDPVKRKLVPLNAYDDNIDPETLLYAGRHIGDAAAFQIALGNKDIDTLQQIDDYNPDASQPSQPRSRGWNDRTASQKLYCVNSIWSRDYKPDHNTDVTTCSTHFLEKSTTKGIEKIISIRGLKLPSKELLVKRSRSEELSDGDLLSQYSFSKAKKPKKENSEDGEPQKSISAVSMIRAPGDSLSKQSANSQPKVRNKFASFLQKKNEENGAIVVPGTRSRFFCHDTHMPDSATKNEAAQPPRNVEVDCQAQETKSITEDPVPPCLETEKFTRTISSSPVEIQRSCFSWSGSLGESPGTPSPSPGVLLLQQFHRQRNDQVVSQGGEVSGLHTVSKAASDESDEESSPLPEMDCSSQSQGSSELSENSADSSRILQESDCRLKGSDDPSSWSSPLFSATCTERKHTPLRSKVPGLQRSHFVRSNVSPKLKPLMPAKVSGLSKKLSSAQKKNHHNAENKPGLQVTISDLWKNFQFRRDSEKLPSCKKSSDPLSPIKDNIQLTPETEEEIFNQLEYSHVQRAIFQ